MKISDLTTKHTVMEVHPVVLRGRSLITEDILTEQMLYENFLDSVKQYLGNKYNASAASIQGGIDDFVEAGILLKDVVQDANKLAKAKRVADRLFNKYLEKIQSKLSDTSGTVKTALAEQAKKFLAGVTNVANRIRNMSGWVGFLLTVAVCSFLKFISEKTVALFAVDTAVSQIPQEQLDILIKYMEQLLGLAVDVKLGPLYAILGLVAVKKNFFDILTYIKSQITITLSKSRMNRFSDFNQSS